MEATQSVIAARRIPMKIERLLLIAALFSMCVATALA